MITNFLF